MSRKGLATLDFSIFNPLFPEEISQGQRCLAKAFSTLPIEINRIQLGGRLQERRLFCKVDPCLMVDLQKVDCSDGTVNDLEVDLVSVDLALYLT